MKAKQILQKLKSEIQESNMSKEGKDLTIQIIDKYEEDTFKTCG